MKRREFIKMISAAGTASLSSGCFDNSANVPSSETPGNAKDLGPADLRCEYLENPLGIDSPKPRLSWRLDSSVRGQRQTAYRVLVASSPEKLKDNLGDLWDTGKVASDQSTHVDYGGKPLESSAQCVWKVSVWDKDGIEILLDALRSSGGPHVM